MNKDTVNRKEAGEILKVSPQRVGQLAKDDDSFPIPVFEAPNGLGKQKWWRRVDIEAWGIKHPRKLATGKATD